MSTNIQLLLLIHQGKKTRERQDIINLIEVDKAVTIGILDHYIEGLQDKAIRNFIEKLEALDFVKIFNYKIPGDRWVQIIKRKDAEFNLHDVIAKHKATRKQRRIYEEPQETLFVYDIPFEVRFRNTKEYDLINEALDIRMAFYGKGLKEATRIMKITLNKMRFKNKKLMPFLKLSKEDH